MLIMMKCILVSACAVIKGKKVECQMNKYDVSFIGVKTVINKMYNSLWWSL